MMSFSYWEAVLGNLTHPQPSPMSKMMSFIYKKEVSTITNPDGPSSALQDLRNPDSPSAVPKDLRPQGDDIIIGTIRKIFMTLRPKKKKTIQKYPKKTKAEYQAEYREKLKTDPDKWQDYLSKQKHYSRAWRQNLIEDKRKELSKKNNARNKLKRIEKKSAATEMNVPAKKKDRLTRSQIAINEMSQAKRREYWKERQRKRRATMTEDERERISARARALYAEKNRKTLHQEVQTDSCNMPCETTRDHCNGVISVPQPLMTMQSPLNNLVVNLQASMPTPDVVCEPLDSSLVTKELDTAFIESPSKQAKYSALSRSKKKMPSNPKTKIHVLAKLLLECSSPERRMLAESLKGSAGKSAGAKTSKSATCLLEAFNSCTVTNPPVPPKKSIRRKNSVAKQAVINFFDEEAVDLPGQRNYSSRLKMQFKILPFPVKTLHQKFRESNPNLKVSERNFYRSRPQHTKLMKSQQFIQCLCEICENTKLKMPALKSCGISLLDLNSALTETLCEKRDGFWQKLCVSRECSKCGVGRLWNGNKFFIQSIR